MSQHTWLTPSNAIVARKVPHQGRHLRFCTAPDSVCMHVGGSCGKPFSGRASRSRAVVHAIVASALPTPRLFRQTRRFTCILSGAVHTDMHELCGFACLRGEIRTKPQARGKPRGSPLPYPVMRDPPEYLGSTGLKPRVVRCTVCILPLCWCKQFCVPTR